MLPIVPLRDWIPEMLTPSGFFAFERAGAEPLSSWFLAASPDSPVFLRLWEEILRFWTIPRRPLASNPADAVGSVAPDKGGLTDQYPYFWFHYLFRYLTETNDEIADIWAKRVHWSADWPHKLQFLFRDTAFPSMFEIVEAAAGAPVQKLNWRVDHYPLDFFARLGTSDVPIFLTQDRGPLPGGL